MIETLLPVYLSVTDKTVYKSKQLNSTTVQPKTCVFEAELTYNVPV